MPIRRFAGFGFRVLGQVVYGHHGSSKRLVGCYCVLKVKAAVKLSIA